MAAAGSLISYAGLALQAGGAAASYSTAEKAAKARKAAAEFEAQQLEQNAGQVISASQRQAFETTRTGKYTASRALAVAAASGGGASDPTVMNTMSQLASETAYRKSLDLYQGEERARQLRLSAAATRMTGDIGAAASIGQGQAALIQGGSGIASELTRMYRPTTTASDIPTTMFARYGYRSPTIYDEPQQLGDPSYR